MHTPSPICRRFGRVSVLIIKTAHIVPVTISSARHAFSVSGISAQVALNSA